MTPAVAVPPGAAPHGSPTHAAVAEVVRGSYGRLLAYLASGTGDIAAAEDALADALLAALRTWPERGVPARPDSWLVTVARRNLVDVSRRRATATRALPQLALLAPPGGDPSVGSGIPDVRLQLMFACTHPAVAEPVRSPLMLQTVLGLDAARIASVFLVPTATMAQRLVRAKTKIRTAGIPFAVPPDEVLPARLGAVLDAVYAAYTAGWDPPVDPATDQTPGPDLAGEAVRLAGLLVDLVPDHAEAHGLLALLLHCEARRPARRTPAGAFVPLDQQDTRLWSRGSMARAEEHLARALPLGDVGPYQLMAAVQSVHNRRAATGRTDHAAVEALYEGLVHVSPTTGVRVAHAAAVSAAGDPARALHLLDGLADRGQGYQPYWVARSSVLDRLDRRVEAAGARATAVSLTTDDAVRAHLTGR
ncbi:RNA polymerase sigma factor [Jannaschia sp. R86511]|uniref:RNA polymerase sigma factor n=1 Tax=Jannaschia sp. R86511 TaxID=3093853 RepID=UPI0036D32BBC